MWSRFILLWLFSIWYNTLIVRYYRIINFTVRLKTKALYPKTRSELITDSQPRGYFVIELYSNFISAYENQKKNYALINMFLCISVGFTFVEWCPIWCWVFFSLLFFFLIVSLFIFYHSIELKDSISISIPFNSV